MKKALITLLVIALALVTIGCQRDTKHATKVSRPEAALIDYAANLSIVRGHLRSSLAGLSEGDYAIAELHTGHPVEEGNVSVVLDELKRSDQAFSDLVSDTFDQLSDSAGSGDSQAVEGAMKLLDEALRALVPDSKSQDLKFQSQVLIKMLESVKDQYAEGVFGGSMTEESEYADAYGIYKEIRALYEELAEKVPEPQNQEIQVLFAEVDKAFPTVSLENDPIPAKVIQAQIDTIIGKLKTVAQID